jgi:tetratricopeptide (TPR) repeat protein
MIPTAQPIISDGDNQVSPDDQIRQSDQIPLGDEIQLGGRIPLDNQIRHACALHQSGKFAEAGMIYDAVLRQQPDHFDVLHLAGILALQTGRPEQGVALIGKALGLREHDAGTHSNLGTGLRALRRLVEALASHDRAIALQPDFAKAYCNRGLVLADLQRHAEALASYDRAIALKPNFAEAHSNRGVILTDLQRHAEALVSFDRAIVLAPNLAEAYYNRANLLADLRHRKKALADYDRAVALRPGYAEAHYNRARLLTDLRRYADALAGYDRVLALQPDHADAHANRGAVLADLQRHAEALASHDRALALRPDHAEAHANRGVVLADLRRYEEALASCDRAIALRPDYADAYVNRSVVLSHLQRYEDALASCDRAIVLQPDHAEPHYNRAKLLADLQRHADALASYDRAIAVKPDHAEANWNQSHCLLALGQLDRGWRLFEWRKQLDRPAGTRAFPKPLWLGQESIAGKTLFIHWEQGLGDTIQFCRYATLAQALGARVVMSVQEPLRRLLATLGPDIMVTAGNEAPTELDCHCPMMSLPLAFSTTLETIPRTVPYLAADAAAVAAWRLRLSALAGLRVGLCWAGNPRRDDPSAHAIDQRRSFTLAQYAPLAGVVGAHFVSLQKGDAAAQSVAPPAGLRIHDWTDELNDFADTAALIEALDLVITVDTSVAHLAGALGKKVWILNRFDSCWRWLTERDDSPWYPTARLFRQPKPGDWDSVIPKVVAALRNSARAVPDGPILPSVPMG